MNDSRRIQFLGELIKNCPTVSFHFNDELTMEEVGGPPLGFTIRIDDVCEPAKATGHNFRNAVDRLMRQRPDRLQRATPEAHGK